ncbi:MAG: sigma-70 family RNA polymerase sigma factor [Verrucomicrobiales bacterium]|nr:sigma-70 family RNA polymerase sigma factor [Verrucomicrobiales bacterium]
MSVTTDLSRATDESLLQSCLQNADRDAFAVIVDRYKNLLCSVAYNIVGDISQSEDIAQDTFLIAWKDLASLRDRSRFKSWLCGIARNKARAFVRKRKPELSDASEQFAADSSGNPDSETVKQEEESLVWETLETLPETYREPLILFYREDQSISRVADKLELNEDAVKQRLSRGRKLLREKVTGLIEGTLTNTKPGPAFTLAVIGALPGFLATGAAAAGVGTAGKAAGVGGSLAGGALAGTAGGMLGGLIGWWIGDQTARYPEQRAANKRGMIRIFLGVAIFQLPWIALGLGWWSPQQLGAGTYLALQLTWMLLFFLFVGWMSWRIGVANRRICRENENRSAPEIPPTSTRKFLQRREGRRWNSRATLFGLPLVSIQFSDPDRDFSGSGFNRKEKLRLAKGWIALGDKAVGLFAVGNIAFGGVAIGGLSCGLLSFGGLALGGVAFGGLTVAGVSLGGLALGLAAIGGIGIGVWAYGGAAISWIASKGGFALANHYAVGGEARAKEANNEIAETFLAGHPVFEWGDAWLRLLQNPLAQPVMWCCILLPIAAILCIGYRSRPDAGSGEE